MEMKAGSSKGKMKMCMFERNISGRIYGPIKKNCIWKSSYNHENKI
jgi:hypothetical protein